MANDKPPFEVLPYSIDDLKKLFADPAKTTADLAGRKTHLIFFEGYFAHASVAAKTIVVEHHYVDHDFLEDFAAYYVRCFHEYPKKCSRLHFFRHAFTKDEFAALLGGDDSKLTEKQLREAYLGFVVAKPLPHCFVGRTCLTTYDADGGRRNFTNIRDYDAHLFGIKLKVKSLAFQEQDRVVAACATSALWSAFQATAVLFQHALPSPVEITRAATEHTPVLSRVFPHTDGLTAEQMAYAIRKIGLEPLHVNLEGESEFVLRASVRAYLSYKIPVILVIELQESNGDLLGLHACTITGYSLPTTAGAPPAGLVLHSDGINELYVHDDQVGPFARMKIDTTPGDFHLTTSWGLPDMKDVRAVPKALLIPLYHKIRIPFEEVVHLVKDLDEGWTVLRGLSKNPFSLETDQPTWDIRLTGNNDFKQEMAQSAAFAAADKLAARCLDLPRFLWRATATSAKGVCIDLLIDATDISDGRLVRHLYVREANLKAVFTEIQNAPAAQLNPAFGGVRSFTEKLLEPLV